MNILEVIVCSVEDARAAELGGAQRLEVVRDLHLGGLTPPFELVREIKSAVDLPLRVMLRENVGFGVSDEVEVERLCEAAREFELIGVDGVVLGFVKDDEVDSELTQRILASAPSVAATFHHAFEAAADKVLALAEIGRLPQVDRILSSGGAGPPADRVARLGDYERMTGLKILAGGGVDASMIELIGNLTNIREFHVGRAARREFRVDGEVRVELVCQLVETIQRIVGSDLILKCL